MPNVISLISGNDDNEFETSIIVSRLTLSKNVCMICRKIIRINVNSMEISPFKN
jgi:hypothetical protein